MYDLSGRVALVTGGGTGVGLRCAQGLAACGAKVYITGHRLDILKKAGPPNIGEEAGWDFSEISTFPSDKKFQICQFSSGKNPA